MVTVTDYRNPVYKSADGQVIDLEVNTAEHGWIPITVNLSEVSSLPHIQQIQSWLAANTATIAPYVAPPPEPVPVPQYVSKIALKYALGAQWPTVKAAINADPALKEDWDLTYRVYRNSPLMTGTATTLGFTDAQIDDIFRAAEAVAV